jgi:hypothetical protein
MTDDTNMREYRIARGAFALRLDDETLIWNPDAEALHRLNAAATLVWEALDTWATADAVCDQVTRSSGLDASDVRHCVEELYEIGVVERRVQLVDHAPPCSSASN